MRHSFTLLYFSSSSLSFYSPFTLSSSDLPFKIVVVMLQFLFIILCLSRFTLRFVFFFFFAFSEVFSFFWYFFFLVLFSQFFAFKYLLTNCCCTKYNCCFGCCCNLLESCCHCNRHGLWNLRKRKEGRGKITKVQISFILFGSEKHCDTQSRCWWGIHFWLEQQQS